MSSETTDAAGETGIGTSSANIAQAQSPDVNRIQPNEGENDSLKPKTKKGSPDIFATIWNLPETHVSVTKIGKDGNPVDPDAKVWVHEQGKAGNCLDEDHAPEPLLVVPDETIFEEPTFKTFIALLDNYTAAEKRAEVGFDDEANPHWKEVDSFLDAVFQSKTMQVAVEHIQTVLAPDTSIEEIRRSVRTMWFEPYTNRYRNDQPYCVGFEHVFVGEDESNESGAPNCEDRVGGYHSWVKFYLEQKAGKADYLGYDYPEGDIEDALNDHKVTTIVMRWSPTADDDGSYGHDLMKKPGGFFVGTRPELEIAFGTLALYSQQANQFDNINGKENHHRVKLGDNFFDIVMHPQTLAPPQSGNPGQRGDHIRTLYPKFRGSVPPSSSEAGGATVHAKIDLPTQPHNDSPIQIARALVNPAAPDDAGEWVELTNATDSTTFDLANWRLSDQSGREKKLEGSLEPGKTVRVLLERKNDDSMMLKNGNGWVVLFQKDVRRAAVRYSKPDSDVVTEFLK